MSLELPDPRMFDAASELANRIFARKRLYFHRLRPARLQASVRVAPSPMRQRAATAASPMAFASIARAPIRRGMIYARRSA